jgi:hypothetical protein
MSYIHCIQWRLFVDEIIAHLTLQAGLERRVRKKNPHKDWAIFTKAQLGNHRQREHEPKALAAMARN